MESDEKREQKVTVTRKSKVARTELVVTESLSDQVASPNIAADIALAT